MSCVIVRGRHYHEGSAEECAGNFPSGSLTALLTVDSICEIYEIYGTISDEAYDVGKICTTETQQIWKILIGRLETSKII